MINFVKTSYNEVIKNIHLEDFSVYTLRTLYLEKY